MPSLSNTDFWYTEDEGKEHLLTASYYYHPGSKGARGELGVPLEPDETPSVDIILIQTQDGELPAFSIANFSEEIAIDLASVQIIQERTP